MADVVEELENSEYVWAKLAYVSGEASLVRWTDAGLLPPIAVVLRPGYQLVVCNDSQDITGKHCS